jgi:hypothetical protein
MRPRVSTLLFLSALFIEIGTDKDFDSIVATVTEYMSKIGEIDVEATLLIKNPPSRLHHRTFLSHHRPYAW